MRMYDNTSDGFFIVNFIFSNLFWDFSSKVHFSVFKINFMPFSVIRFFEFVYDFKASFGTQKVSSRNLLVLLNSVCQIYILLVWWLQKIDTDWNLHIFVFNLIAVKILSLVIADFMCKFRSLRSSNKLHIFFFSYSTKYQ